MTDYSAAGPLANQQYAAVPSSVSSYSGTWLATFQLNSDGTIASQADDCPHIPGLSDSGVPSVLSATPVGSGPSRRREISGRVRGALPADERAHCAAGPADEVRASGPLASQQYAGYPPPSSQLAGATFQSATRSLPGRDIPASRGPTGVLSVLSATPVGSVPAPDGTIYNFGSGAWEALPSTGVPTAQQVRALTRYAASGPLASQQYALVPSPVFSNSGIWLSTFQLNSDGTIASQADDYPCIPEIFNSYALDNSVVHLAGAEAITGVKTFSTLPTLGALTGLHQSHGGAITTATPGTDYVMPSGSIAGTAGNVSGTVAIANGGTGKTTDASAFNALSPIATLGDLIYGSGTNTGRPPRR